MVLADCSPEVRSGNPVAVRDSAGCSEYLQYYEVTSGSSLTACYSSATLWNSRTCSSSAVRSSAVTSGAWAVVE